MTTELPKLAPSRLAIRRGIDPGRDFIPVVYGYEQPLDDLKGVTKVSLIQRHVI